jgi:PAS domain S-box-containing protein
MTDGEQSGWIPASMQGSSVGWAMLGALFHGHPDMLIVTDAHDRIVAANSLALTTLGYRRHDLEAQPIHKLVPADLRPRHEVHTSNFASHPSSRPMGSGIDLSICDSSGAEHPVDVSLRPFSAEGHQLVLVVCRKMDEDLARKQHQIHALVENARGYAVILLDREGRILTWNKGAEQLYGLSASEALGQNHSILFEKDERASGEPERQLERAILSEEPVVLEGWRPSAAGARMWSESRCVASRDFNGQVTGFTRVIHDMTGHKLIEAELQESNRALEALAAELESRVSQRTQQLEELVMELRQKKAEVEAYAEAMARDLREKEVLLREVYHRVKNNLQVVQSLLKMKGRTLSSADAREAIDAAVQRIQVMATVHERLYQMPDLASLSLPVFLKDIVDGAVNSSNAHSNLIGIDLAADGIAIDLDLAIPLGLLVHELVSNCLKHGLREDVQQKIKVSIVRTLNGAQLIIQDNGPGLPEGFEIAKCKSMGLKVAASLAQRLGGQLEFTNENGCRVETDLTRLEDATNGESPNPS